MSLKIYSVKHFGLVNDKRELVAFIQSLFRAHKGIVFDTF